MIDENLTTSTCIQQYVTPGLTALPKVPEDQSPKQICVNPADISGVVSGGGSSNIIHKVKRPD